jgi:hypothetical protein
MKAFCITIPRLADRREYVRDTWDFVDYEFFYGVDYQFHDVFQIRDDLGKRQGATEAPKLAIYLSHLLLWRELLRQPGDGWLVFEDDCEPLLPEALLQPRRGFLKYHVPDPKKFPPWVGTACYWVDRVAVRRLYNYPVAFSPDLVIHHAIRPLEVHSPKAAGVHFALECSYAADDPIKQLPLL